MAGNNRQTQQTSGSTDYRVPPSAGAGNPGVVTAGQFNPQYVGPRQQITAVAAPSTAPRPVAAPAPAPSPARYDYGRYQLPQSGTYQNSSMSGNSSSSSMTAAAPGSGSFGSSGQYYNLPTTRTVTDQSFGSNRGNVAGAAEAPSFTGAQMPYRRASPQHSVQQVQHTSAKPSTGYPASRDISPSAAPEFPKAQSSSAQSSMPNYIMQSRNNGTAASTGYVMPQFATNTVSSGNSHRPGANRTSPPQTAAYSAPVPLAKYQTTPPVAAPNSGYTRPTQAPPQAATDYTKLSGGSGVTLTSYTTSSTSGTSSGGTNYAAFSQGNNRPPVSTQQPTGTGKINQPALRDLPGFEDVDARSDRVNSYQPGSNHSSYIDHSPKYEQDFVPLGPNGEMYTKKTSDSSVSLRHLGHKPANNESAPDQAPSGIYNANARRPPRAPRTEDRSGRQMLEKGSSARFTTLLLKNNREYQLAMLGLLLAGLALTLVLSFLFKTNSFTRVVGVVTGGLVSVISCVSVIVTYNTRKTWRKHPNPLIYYRSWCDLLFVMGLLVDTTYKCASSAGCSSNNIPGSNECYATATITQFSLLAAESWFFMMALDLYQSLTNPFTDYKRNVRFYHAFVWGTALLSAILLASIQGQIDTSPIADTCWTKWSGKDSTSFNQRSWLFFYVWLLIYYSFGIYVRVFAWNRIHKGMLKTLSMRLRVLNSVTTYVVAIVVYWTIVLAFYIPFLYKITRKFYEYDIVGLHIIRVNSPDQMWLKQTVGFLIAAKGFVDFLVWFSINEWSEQDKADSKKKNAALDVDLNPQLNTALRGEIRYYTTQGIMKAVQAVPSLKSSVVEEPYVLIPPDGIEPPKSSRTVFHDFFPHEFEKIRKLFGVSNEEYCRSLSQVTKEKISEGASGAFMFFSKDQKYIVKSMSAEESKFLRNMVMLYSKHLEQNPKTLLTRFYGCHAVHFGLYKKTFYFVVMANVFETNLVIHARYDLKGSWVNRSHSKPKAGAMVTCRHCNAKYRYGSDADELNCEARGGSHEPDTVLKDNDVTSKIRLDRKEAEDLFTVLEKDSNFLSKRRIMDYSLLVGVHNVKYHVGNGCVEDEFVTSGGKAQQIVQMQDAQMRVEFLHPTSNHDLRGKTAGYNESMKIADTVVGPQYYYFGLIDILQEWNFQKKMERFTKVVLLRKDGAGLSAIPPEEYKTRFQNAMERLLGLDDFSEY